MRLGIFAKTFSRPSLDATLDAVVEHGIETIQFNMALTTAGFEETRAAVAGRGLEMAAVSGTYNMAHPDRAIRDAGAGWLAKLIAAAPHLGTRVVTLCTGTRDPDDMWRAHPGNATPEAWRDSVEQIAGALAVAERHGVVLAFEPEHNNVVVDAAAGRRLLDELRSAHLQVVVDAANLVRPGELDRQAETPREAFALLGDAPVLAHAKDVLDNGTVVAAGRGGLDYALYVQLLRESGYDGPLVLHGLDEDEVDRSARFVRERLGLGARA